jgi:hypothetical protein
VQEGDERRYDSTRDSQDLQKEIRSWVDYQDGQRILLTTPVVLLGSRLEVYRAEGTTQWYTAFIHSVSDATKVSTQHMHLWFWLLLYAHRHRTIFQRRLVILY